MRELNSRVDQQGFVLLAVTVVLMIVTLSAFVFISFMGQQMTWASKRYRAAAARHLADAGLTRFLAVLESMPSERAMGIWSGLGRRSERITPGAPEAEAIVDLDEEGSGVLRVTSRVTVGDAKHKLEVQVYPASTALLAGVYSSLIQIDAPGSIAVTSHDERSTRLDWVHLASREVRFVGLDAAVLGSEQNRILMPKEGDFAIGREGYAVTLQELRAAGVPISEPVRHVSGFPSGPVIDRAYYQQMARLNTGNEDMNRTAGWRMGSSDLANKRDSLYEPEELADLIRYAKGQDKPLLLHGVVYVKGGIELLAEDRLEVVGGGVIAEGTIKFGRGTSVVVSQRLSGAVVPGVAALRGGSVIIGEGAHVQVAGIVYAEGTIEIWEAGRLEVVGAVINAGQMGLTWNSGGRLNVFYDPRILGTAGLHARAKEPVVAWLVSRKEHGRR